MDVIERVRAELRDLDPPTEPGATAHAAVAAVLRPGERGAEVLLIRREEREADPWSGHMALPGGRRDAVDADLLATAVRETREEVGLDLEAAGELLGRLPSTPAFVRGVATGIVVSPFVFRLHAAPVLTPAAGEVRETVWANVPALMRGEHDAVFRYVHGGATHDLPAFDVEGRVVWGLTYLMLRRLFEAVRGEAGHG